MACQVLATGFRSQALRCSTRLQYFQKRHWQKMVRIKPLKDPVFAGWPVPTGYPNNRTWIETEESKRTLIVRGVWYNIQNHEIEEAFAPCGTIEKIVRPRDLATGKLRRFCYVRFEDSKSVDTALEMLNPMIDDVELKRKASQGYALKIPKINRKTQRSRPPFCRTIFVANINRKDPQLDDDDLVDFFEQHVGGVSNAIILKQEYTGESRGIGFVEFNTQNGVMDAIKLVGEKWEGRELWIDYANSYPHHLGKFKQREDTDVDPETADDLYVGTRTGALGWMNKPFCKTGEDGVIKKHSYRTGNKNSHIKGRPKYGKGSGFGF